MKADINVIEHTHLAAAMPTLVRDGDYVCELGADQVARRDVDADARQHRIRRTPDVRNRRG